MLSGDRVIKEVVRQNEHVFIATYVTRTNGDVAELFVQLENKFDIQKFIYLKLELTFYACFFHMLFLLSRKLKLRF